MTTNTVNEKRPRPQENLRRSEISIVDVNEEIGALGASLLDPEQASQLIAELTPADFSYFRNGLIFEAMVSAGAPFDWHAIGGELQRRGHLDEVGWDYITHLDYGVVPERPMAKRIARLQELRRLRQLAQLGEEIRNAPFEVGASSMEIVNRLRTRLAEIAG